MAGETKSMVEAIKLESQNRCDMTDYKSLAESYNHLTLENIAKRGIISCAEAEKQGLCLRSFDSGTSERLSCNAINLTVEPADRRDAAIRKAIKYLIKDKDAGIHHIAQERSYPMDQNETGHISHELFRTNLQNRLETGVVFLLNDPSLRYSLKTCLYFEQRCDESLAPSCIQAILVPDPLKEMVQTYFPSTPLIVLGTEKIEVCFNGQRDADFLSKIVSQKDRGSKIILGDGSSYKIEYSPTIEPLLGKFQLQVPNYSAGLNEYIQKFKAEKFMLHFTRLATPEDLTWLSKVEIPELSQV